jgi:hypothetical protein
MGAWKQFLASDIIVNPFVVNKSFSYSASLWDTDDVGIDYFVGRNIPFVSGSNKTGFNNTQYQSLIYNSVKQLYYTNFLSSSTGDNVAQPVLVPGFNASGDVLIGEVQSPLYDNFLQSTLVPNRFFPTASESYISLISIPSKIYGEYIVPTSLIAFFGSYTFTDDGQGNLLYNNIVLGNVIYTQGMVIFTNSDSGKGPTVIDLNEEINDNIANCKCLFSSSMTIYEAQYKCTLRESEFNATLNPSAQTSGSLLTVNSSSFYQRGDGTLSNNVTGSYFSPYVTTVGLYDEAQNLLAVGKLAQPLPTSPTTDTTILVNIDK